MKFFIDSANLDEIEKAAQTGLIDGVTTNPSLVSKSGMAFEALLEKITSLVDGPISAEVTVLDSAGMISQGGELASIHPNIVVKLPLNTEGLKACQALTQKGIRTNVTLCFQPVQALLAAKSGATYVSPFVGRLDDIGQNGMSLIRDIKTIYDHYSFGTQILVASIRHTEHMLEAARIGAHVATLPYSVFTKLVHHPLTDKGLDQFMKDWKSATSSS